MAETDDLAPLKAAVEPIVDAANGYAAHVARSGVYPEVLELERGLVQATAIKVMLEYVLVRYHSDFTHDGETWAEAFENAVAELERLLALVKAPP